MRFITSALEMHHTINAGKRCAAALVAMRVKLLLGKDITARLDSKGTLSAT